MKIISIVGARPQFIKLAPLCQKLKKQNKINHIIIHTGQHYDFNMSKLFFNELGIKTPKYHLGVGSGSHGKQTGEMLKKIEYVLLVEKPSIVITFGDTNSTLAGALASKKLHIPTAHIEAGLRSYNKKMPEEINRILTDHCSNLLFCPTSNAVNNLRKEGFINIYNKGILVKKRIKYSKKIFKTPLVINVGDIMFDAFKLCLKISKRKSNILEYFNIKPKKYFLATVHRAENTDNIKNLHNILKALAKISKVNPIIFPIHPRTYKIMKINGIFYKSKNIKFINPVGYFDMINLEKNAKMILTDSGGMQKEAYFVETPCVTLRNETEWIETVKSGWNIVSGTNSANILKSFDKFDNKIVKKSKNKLYGEGISSNHIVTVCKKYCR